VKNMPLTSPHFGQYLTSPLNSGLFWPIKIGKGDTLSSHADD